MHIEMVDAIERGIKFLVKSIDLWMHMTIMKIEKKQNQCIKTFGTYTIGLF